jgi:hypothetical protein
LAARFVRDEEAAGSNPATPTQVTGPLPVVGSGPFCARAPLVRQRAQLGSPFRSAGGRSGSRAPGRRRYQRRNWLITFARSVPMAAVARSASSQSASSTRTERCCVLGLLGTRPSLSAVVLSPAVVPLPTGGDQLARAGRARPLPFPADWSASWRSAGRSPRSSGQRCRSDRGRIRQAS